jgi:hypothetical protein
MRRARDAKRLGGMPQLQDAPSVQSKGPKDSVVRYQNPYLSQMPLPLPVQSQPQTQQVQNASVYGSTVPASMMGGPTAFSATAGRSVMGKQAVIRQQHGSTAASMQQTGVSMGGTMTLPYQQTQSQMSLSTPFNWTGRAAPLPGGLQATSPEFIGAVGATQAPGQLPAVPAGQRLPFTPSNRSQLRAPMSASVGGNGWQVVQNASYQR